MRQILPDILLVEGLRISNVYLIVSGAELTLIDTGMVGDAKQIVTQLRDSGYELKKLKRIILTHAHGDHTGSTRELVSLSGAQVIAHCAEVPYIEKVKLLPANSPVQRMMNWMSDRIMFRQPGVHVDVAVDDTEILDVSGGLSVVHSPGHTPGSMSLYFHKRGVLFCGDALFNAHPITRKPGLQLPLRIVNTDPDQVRESVMKLSKLAVKVLCCGHGDPIVQGAQEKIKALLSQTGVSS